ncbi:MAG: Aquaporin Z [Chlorobi bacterium OLB7]|nr:MAG: Aquaporin Z [Chlorobi bacterium OLB7]
MIATHNNQHTMETRTHVWGQSRRVVAEGIGTGLLLAAVVGSALMAEQLAAGNTALALLANSIATAGALIALITTFLPISGAHFNPALTLAEAWNGRMEWREVPGYVTAQILGGIAGVVVANVMFGNSAVAIADHERSGFAQLFGEVVATFGLLAVIFGTAHKEPERLPMVVGMYILAAYWFTASSAFANPALSIARIFTETNAGIRPADALAFVVAQLVGGTLAVLLFRWFGKK